MSKLSLKNITKKIGSGATPTGGQNAYQNSGISLIRSQNVHDFAFLKNGLAYINEEQANNLNNVIVLENDILLNITGDSIARVCKVPKEILPARVNQHVMIIRASSAVDSNYLLCYLQFLKPYLLKICGVGGTRNALTKDVIENLLVELPNLSIQNNIGLLIDNINAKIELNNRINAELEQMAKTLYDYWFVQFDFPNKNGRPYKSSGGKMVWSEELKREVPEGWEVKSLFNVCNVQYGYPFSTEFFNSEGIGKPVIRIRDILENSISNYSSQLEIDTKYEIKIGDVLIGMDGNFHINYWSKRNCFLNQRVVKLSETLLPSIYLKYQVEPFIQLREKSVSRTTVGHLSDKDLKSIKVLVPPTSILNNIRILYKNSLDQILKNNNENQKLTELRDWLLPMLMNGQVKVGDGEGEFRKSRAIKGI